MKGSKNNINNRGKSAIARLHDGQEVKPVRYDGKKLGHGSYMAAAYIGSNKIVIGAGGKPVAYNDCALPFKI